MLRLRRFGRLVAWVTCWAILLGALAPGVTSAMALRAASGAAWTEVCSATGSKWVQGAPEEAPTRSAPAPSGHDGGHCKHCLLHHPSAALPAAPQAGAPFVASGHLLPALFFAAPRPLFAWTSAHPRGPPAAA